MLEPKNQTPDYSGILKSGSGKKVSTMPLGTSLDTQVFDNKNEDDDVTSPFAMAHQWVTNMISPFGEATIFGDNSRNDESRTPKPFEKKTTTVKSSARKTFDAVQRKESNSKLHTHASCPSTSASIDIAEADVVKPKAPRVIINNAQNESQPVSSQRRSRSRSRHMTHSTTRTSSASGSSRPSTPTTTNSHSFTYDLRAIRALEGTSRGPSRSVSTASNTSNKRKQASVRRPPCVRRTHIKRASDSALVTSHAMTKAEDRNFPALPEHHHQHRRASCGSLTTTPKRATTEQRTKTTTPVRASPTTPALRGKRKGRSLGRRNPLSSIKAITSNGLSKREYADWDFLTRPEVTLRSLTKVEKLGRGQFGMVYRVVSSEKMVRDEELQSCESFALKIIDRSRVTSERSKSNIRNEKLIMEKLESDFMVTLINTYHTKHDLYILMEYAPHKDLSSQIDSRSGLVARVPGLFEFYVTNIVLGLKYLHQSDIIHRDIKPGNILIASDGYLKISDFGFSKTLKKNDRTCSIAGTYAYLCPEQCRGEEYGHWCDLWSFGIVIYEMMYGNPPFEAVGAESKKEYKTITMANILEQEIVFPRRCNHGIKLRLFVSSLLHKARSRRLGMDLDYRRILSQPYFMDVQVDMIEAKSIQAPWVPLS